MARTERQRCAKCLREHAVKAGTRVAWGTHLGVVVKVCEGNYAIINLDNGGPVALHLAEVDEVVVADPEEVSA